LDSGTNELFVSHGRRKRSIDEDNRTAGTLSAIIRVLTRDEEEEALQNTTFSHSAFLDELDLVCMSEVWFISAVVSVSIVCLVLSAFIVAWGCSSLKKEKLPL
uniref:ZP domain-containing protein n=1 Tax=Gongylonema pulchrum TaxID=637853 RepID=A0A183DCT2_9BILA